MTQTHETGKGGCPHTTLIDELIRHWQTASELIRKADQALRETDPDRPMPINPKRFSVNLYEARQMTDTIGAVLRRYVDQDEAAEGRPVRDDDPIVVFGELLIDTIEANAQHVYGKLRRHLEALDTHPGEDDFLCFLLG